MSQGSIDLPPELCGEVDRDLLDAVSHAWVAIPTITAGPGYTHVVLSRNRRTGDSSGLTLGMLGLEPSPRAPGRFYEHAKPPWSGHRELPAGPGFKRMVTSGPIVCNVTTCYFADSHRVNTQ